MGKKKFIDKKNSATFQLFARDSSSCDPAAPPASGDADRVFVRVDNNPHYSAPESFGEDGADENGGHQNDVVDDEYLDPYSVFADAADGTDEDDGPPFSGGGPMARPDGAPLPDQEIRRGSNYYENSKAKLDSLPLDVRAYDASRLRIKPEAGDVGTDAIYDVAAKTVGVKIDKAVDPDVVRLLDDSDLSRFGSDVEDLEEDFVARANCLGEAEEDGNSDESSEGQSLDNENEDCSRNSGRERKTDLEDIDKKRRRRPLDEQFDLLMVHEYGDDSNSDDDCYVENKPEELLAPELKHALKEFPKEELDFEETYKVPADFLRQDQTTISTQLVESSADVLLKCVAYAQMYSQEDDNNEKVLIFEESSDESEIWDCETIVSTYSNVDNHPGRIQVPGKSDRKRQVPDLVSVVSSEKSKIIALRGKEMLPVDFLPQSRRTPVEKDKKSAVTGPEQLKRRPNESKEEKKERKAAVKEARREARHSKKQLKELYKCESLLAQKLAAVSGPSSIHLM
ncbi:unnamed protein product [Spirodela intermedia]|uniref:Uncharacterized protein n=1 Tax=Spirodela intermedia TaxID=51605 RepID=A0A7I8IA82_SPIIN|nr:unnamed protein product [Spirodela intermedia]CAA6654559.1 unnamed protein product [Spirodela intermedia]